MMIVKNNKGSGHGKSEMPVRMVMCILAAVLLVIPITGCQGKESRPSFAVSSYMDTVIASDFEAGNAFLKNPATSEDLFISGRDTLLPIEDEAYRQQVAESARGIYAAVTHKVKSSVITGDTAVVSIVITAPDVSSLEGDLMAISFSDMDPDERETQLSDLLLSELQLGASGGARKVEYTVRLDMLKMDGVWKIRNQSPIGHAVIGNISGLIMPSADPGQF